MARRETLTVLLQRLGLSVSEVSRRSGVSRQTITDWAAGRRKPQNEQLAAVAEALAVTVDRMMAAVEASRKA